MTEQEPRAEPPSPAAPAPPAAPPRSGYPPYPYPYPVAPPFNTYAILAAVFAFVVFPPLGIYFGYKAKEQIAQSGERGIELAQVGVIGGWILTGLYAVFVVVWCALAVTFFGTFLGAAASR